jgi:hypothetical protein
MSNVASIPNPAARILTAFGCILASVRRGLALNAARLEGPVQVAIYNPIGQRINRTRDRLIQLAERLQAGWVYCPRPYAPRKTPDPPKDGPSPAPNPLPTGSHWLLRAAPGPDMGAANDQLYQLLHESEVASVLAAAPVPAWRILRPLCHALGVRKPAILGPSKPPKPGKPLYHPPPPLPWDVPLLPEPALWHPPAEPRYYSPRVPVIRPKTA